MQLKELHYENSLGFHKTILQLANLVFFYTIYF